MRVSRNQGSTRVLNDCVVTLAIYRNGAGCRDYRSSGFCACSHYIYIYIQGNAGRSRFCWFPLNVKTGTQLGPSLCRKGGRFAVQFISFGLNLFFGFPGLYIFMRGCIEVA